MGEAIGQVLGNAVGVAISPVPVITLILMLFSPAAGRNGLAFLAGWLLGLTGVGAAVLALGLESAEGGAADGGGVLKVAIGGVFLVLGWRQWRARPRSGEAPAMPAWMAAVDGFGAARALGLGLLLTVPNPKNVGLTIAAATSIGAAGLSAGGELVVLLVFVAVGSLTIVVPLAAYVVAGPRAEPALTAAKDWLVANSAAVMTVLFAVLGAKVLGDGIAVLTRAS